LTEDGGYGLVLDTQGKRMMGSEDLDARASEKPREKGQKKKKKTTIVKGKASTMELLDWEHRAESNIPTEKGKREGKSKR